jgi:CelD/BcsL family acetyltransferase involved in cellulose biosynthesis
MTLVPSLAGAVLARPLPLAVEEISSLLDLQRLRPGWERLVALCGHASPFQTPQWLLPWSARFAPGQVWALAARRGERLVGLLPLRIVEAAGVRTASFLGQGVSDYGGVLVASGRDGEGVTEALLAHLRDRRSGRWDLCDLDQLPPGDPLHAARLPRGLDEESRDQEVCPSVALPASAAALGASLPHRLGPRIERSLRRLHRETQARFERANEGDLEEFLDAFFRLHAAEWHQRGTTGVLADETLQSFHREVAAGMLAAGRLRLYGLRIDGQVRAVLYGFVQGRRFFSYLGGFDPRLAVLSPGTLMIWQAMTAAIAESLEEFDFLRGGEPYKYRWGARDRVNRRRVLK